jgi:hypothetical protein
MMVRDDSRMPELMWDRVARCGSSGWGVCYAA